MSDTKKVLDAAKIYGSRMLMLGTSGFPVDAPGYDTLMEQLDKDWAELETEVAALAQPQAAQPEAVAARIRAIPLPPDELHAQYSSTSHAYTAGHLSACEAAASLVAATPPTEPAPLEAFRQAVIARGRPQYGKPGTRDEDVAKDIALYDAAVGQPAPQAEPAAAGELPPRDWTKIEAIATEYAEGYTLEGDDGFYQPNETERMLILDAVMGLLADDEFLAAFGAAPHAREPLTDEQITDIALASVYNGDATVPYRKQWTEDIGVGFVRAIERAHGIG